VYERLGSGKGTRSVLNDVWKGVQECVKSVEEHVKSVEERAKSGKSVRCRKKVRTIVLWDDPIVWQEYEKGVQIRRTGESHIYAYVCARCFQQTLGCWPQM
jgi:hypothetical protein